jgi:hypothetical protein
LIPAEAMADARLDAESEIIKGKLISPLSLVFVMNIGVIGLIFVVYLLYQ